MTTVNGVIFDYGFTLSSELYFNVVPAGVDQWQSVLTRLIFKNPDVVQPWMRGAIGLSEVAEIVSEEVKIDSAVIMDAMETGCCRLKENMAVKALAVELKRQRVPTALVTANFDVFSEVIVPEHGYDQLFDVIVNSSDYRYTGKRHLWPIAFEGMGERIEYHNTLLIEDGSREPDLFRELGGHAIQYVNDPQLREDVMGYEFVPVETPSG